MNYTLSKYECTALRGFAIIGIFLHNYIHWLGPMVKENEYMYRQYNVDRMLSVLSHPSWDLPLQLFSFFGHYGVPVFLFLSGFGLVKKYESPSAALRPEGMGSILWSRYMKLFPMMFLGFALFTMVDWITPGHHHWTWTDVVAQLTMTINLLPNPDKIIWPGPYWFFGLMMQLYAIYVFVIYRRSNAWVIGLIALSLFLQLLCVGNPEGDTINRLRYNSIGGLLPFGMGVLLGRTAPSTKTPATEQQNGSQQLKYAMAFLGSVAAVFAFSLPAGCGNWASYCFWLMVPFFIVTLHMAMVKILPAILIKGLVWVGGLSSAIFVCHPIPRKIFVSISRGGDIPGGLVLYIVATILLAMFFKKILSSRNN